MGSDIKVELMHIENVISLFKLHFLCPFVISLEYLSIKFLQGFRKHSKSIVKDIVAQHARIPHCLQVACTIHVFHQFLQKK